MEPRRRPEKSKKNTGDLRKPQGKVYSSHRGFHYKKHGEVCPQLPPIFPHFHSVKRRHPGDTVEAILYRGEVMDIPSSVTHISLLCGTNNLRSHSPATISSTITEILIYYDLSVQLHISIYFQFYHDSINFKNTLLLLTLLFIFRFKNCFQNLFFFFTNCHPPCIIQICKGLTNSISPQKAMPTA